MNKSPNVKKLENNLLQITKRLNEMEERLELWFKVEELSETVKEWSNRIRGDTIKRKTKA